MPAHRPTILISTIAIASLFNQCLAQDPTDTVSNEDLRREVAELRATVTELAKRLETMEYQRMPRAEIRSPLLPEPRLAEPSFLSPPVQLARFPVEVHQLPKTIPSPKKTLPTYLLFPEEIERAMLGPF